MGRSPFVVVCIDGVSTTNPTEISRTVHALTDIPCVGRMLPLNGGAYNLVVGEILRLKNYLPSVILSPSPVTLVAQGHIRFEQYNWKSMASEYTLFVTLTENIMDELKTEGSEYLYPVLGPRVKEQNDFISVSQRLGEMGYRTITVNDHGTQFDVAKRVIQSIKLTKRNILELERERTNDE